MVFNNPLSFEMYSYNNNPSAFYTMQQGRIPVEYTGSSTLDERDRRRRRTGSSSSSKDKEVLPNMHLVRPVQVRLPGPFTDSSTATPRTTEHHNEHSVNARKGTSKALNISLRIYTKNTKSSCSPIRGRPTK